MIFFVVAFALLLHVLFWGAGLATLLMPRRWRRFWPVLIPTAGMALQALVVWIGAYANLPGTNRYAWPTELVPVVLLAIGLRRHGFLRWRTDIGRFGLVWAAVGGVLVLLVLPLAIASRGLTTVSLGSCDAADYAAGARVFMEFAHADRAGFLGLTDVVRVMSVDNFFDFWLRLNHFTPSALIALNGSILHCPPDELTGVLTAVVLAATLPVVFWVARTLFGYSGIACLVIAIVYGISPITWYSYAQVSPAPLIAANAIALLGWAGVALWNGLLTWRRATAFAGVLCIAYTLVLGAYNFILLVCLVPAIAYAGSRTLARGSWLRLARWGVAMLAPLVICGLVFWARIAGLLERFLLFQTYDFGWRIPVLGPEGWIGMVEGGDLHAWWIGLRWLLAVAFVAAFGWALARSVVEGRRRVWLVAAVVVPVLLGYGYLELRAVVRHTNASYDAFKLFAVFFPLLLPAFCWWITLRWSSRLLQWLGVVALAIVVVGFNLIACAMFVFHLSQPPLIVGSELRHLRSIEGMSDVASVNMLLPDMWSRLWANAFLLRKPQYFLTHTYEGRLNTPLRGDWDLVSSVIRPSPPDGGVRQISAHYWLLDTRARSFFRAEPAQGWYAEERTADGERWCWTRGDATVTIENPHPRPLTIRLRLDGRAYGERDLSVVCGSAATSPIHIGPKRAWYETPPLTIPPGRSTVMLRSQQGSDTPPDDSRPLSFCVFSLVIEPVQ